MKKKDFLDKTPQEILRMETFASRDKRRFMAFTPEEVVQIITLLKGRDPKILDRIGRPAGREKYTVEVIREVQDQITTEAVLKS